jgi:hypothetical protein
VQPRRKGEEARLHETQSSEATRIGLGRACALLEDSCRRPFRRAASTNIEHQAEVLRR